MQHPKRQTKHQQQRKQKDWPIGTPDIDHVLTSFCHEIEHCSIRRQILVPEKIGTRFHDTHARIWRQFSGAGFWRRFLVCVSFHKGSYAWKTMFCWFVAIFIMLCVLADKKFTVYKASPVYEFSNMGSLRMMVYEVSPSTELVHWCFNSWHRPHSASCPVQKTIVWVCTYTVYSSASLLTVIKSVLYPNVTTLCSGICYRLCWDRPMGTLP